MIEKNIKSADRVKDHGEVFTPKRIVNLMLNQPEITAKINELDATFLEPSAGEGAFLTELLSRKMKVAFHKSQNHYEYGVNCLIGLASLYGIELLEDNVKSLVMNMNNVFHDEYCELIQHHYKVQPDKRILKSAHIIINANMAQGNALTRLDSKGNPIIFSEWATIKSKKNLVQRTEYTFDQIIEEAESNGSVRDATEQLDLFALDDGQSVQESFQYVPCKWENIYQETRQSGKTN